MHIFNIAPFPPTRYVLKGFRWMEVSNRERNWNKVKYHNYVGSKFQLCQLDIPIFLYKIMFQNSLIIPVSFVFCEFNRVGSWNEGKTTIIISNSQIEIQVSYSRSTFVNVNISFPNSNFEGNFCTYVFGKSFWHYRERKIDCCTSRHTLCEKSFNTFECVEVRFLVEKWNIYKAHIFPRPLLQTCRWETTSLCLNTRLIVNKKLSNSHYFYWN